MKKALLFAGSLGLVFTLVGIASAASFGRDLTIGSQGTDVTDLQNFLTQQGVYTGPVTGYFGPLTQEGVKKFQEAHQITPVAGYFGPLTRSAANGLLGVSQAASVVSAAPAASAASSQLDTVAALLKQLQALKDELAGLTAAAPAPAATTTPAVPAVTPATTTPVTAVATATPAVTASSLPNPFTSPMTIVSDYPSRTLSSYTSAILNEYVLSGAPEKVAITKLRVTNVGTFSDIYINELALSNSLTGQVLATTGAPVDGVAEFVMTPDASKPDKGVMVSGGIYTITGALRTPNIGGTKPYLELDVASSTDVTAVDYATLSRTADLGGSNAFPIIGPRISAF
ncbi:peptidoglycan-binding protein [Patescibacteria group bacterium]|nr:peptidoglycan-binding protein [Patescibacteria group bacterium]